MAQLPLAEFERKHGVKLLSKLGDGKDGVIVQTDRISAVKFFYQAQVYTRELRAYRIIRSNQIDEVLGHQVPQLLNDDDELNAIEMSIVSPPFILDFAAAYSRDEVEHFGFTDEVMCSPFATDSSN
ncbi:hypothetical protein [Fontivita pretiosa]|uniref:hypothetical protein n=1 Tax=Fontivita pretiosa TaxID=2989684 RepID=UPI003D1707E6